MARFKVVRVMSTDLTEFELHQGIMMETNSTCPYIAQRGSILRAILFPTDVKQVQYSISTDGPYQADFRDFHASDGHIDIGCQTFIGKNAAALRKWAVKIS